MKETIRCCISCILPCGALDVIRIMHASGRVEEISGKVSAGEIMQAYPNHVLRKPPSASEDGVVSKAVILPPDAELQRGKIYFLMPVSSSSSSSTSAAAAGDKARSGSGRAVRRRRRRREGEGNNGASATDRTRLLVSEQYLSEILSEKASTHRDRRRGRVGVWRPHLESISEVSNDF